MTGFVINMTGFVLNINGFVLNITRVSLSGRETSLWKVCFCHPARLKRIDVLKWFIHLNYPIKSAKSEAGVVFCVLLVQVSFAYCPLTA